MDKSLNIKVSATDEASSVMEKAEKAVSKLHGAAGGEGHGGGFEGLKGAFGRGSALFETAHLLDAGGPVRGIKLASDLIQEATKKFGELNAELHEGKIEAGEFVDKLAGGIPIIGQFWQVGRAIHELMTGDEAAAKHIREEAEAGVKFGEMRLELQKASQKAAEEHEATMHKLRGEGAAIGLPPEEAEHARRQQSLEEAEAERQKKLRETTAKIQEDYAKAANHQQSRIVAAQRALEDARAEAANAVGELPPEASPDSRAQVFAAGQAEVRSVEGVVAAHQNKLKALHDKMQKDIADAENGSNDERLQRLTNFDNETVQREGEADRRAIEQQRARDERLADLDAQARAARFKAIGDDVDAELTLMRSAADKAIAEAQRHGEAEKQNVEDIEREKQTIRERFAADEDALLAKDAEKLREHNADIFREFGKFQQQQHRRSTDPVRFAPLEESSGSGIGDRLRSDIANHMNDDKAADAVDKLPDKLYRAVAQPIIGALEDMAKGLASPLYAVFSGR